MLTSKSVICNPRWWSFIKVTHELLKTTFSSLSLVRVYPKCLFNQIPCYPVRMESWHLGLSQFVQTTSHSVYPVERALAFSLIVGLCWGCHIFSLTQISSTQIDLEINLILRTMYCVKVRELSEYQSLNLSNAISFYLLKIN